MGGPCVGCVLCSRGTRASSLLSPPGLGTGPSIQQAFHNVCSVTNGKWRPREHLTEQGNFGLCPPPPIQGSVAPPLQPHLRGQLGLSQLDTAAAPTPEPAPTPSAGGCASVTLLGAPCSPTDQSPNPPATRKSQGECPQGCLHICRGPSSTLRDLVFMVEF